MSELRRFRFEIELIVRDEQAVISAGKKLFPFLADWRARVIETDGDELCAAMDGLFNGSFIVPDRLGEAVEFYSGSGEELQSVPSNWSTVT